MSYRFRNSRKWAPSKSARKEFADKMREIDDYCALNGITRSASGDSYYFVVCGRNYRVSNHTVAASNRGAWGFDEFGRVHQKRELYHDGGECEDCTYITAGKTRIIEIHQNLLAGAELDRRGNVK